jgi:hypothetical protein
MKTIHLRATNLAVFTGRFQYLGTLLLRFALFTHLSPFRIRS